MGPSFLILLTLTGPGDGPGSPTLSVATPAGWREWWRSDRAPARWEKADALLQGAVRWNPTAAGVERGELRLSGDGEAWRVGVVLVRFDPAQVDLRLA